MAQIKIRTVLWIDSAAGALSGFNTLVFGGWMVDWFHLPRALLTVLGCISLVYACYSGSLAWREIEERRWLRLLVFANLAYSAFCCVLAVRFSDVANGLGVAYLLGDAGVVAALAVVEWWVFRGADLVAGER